MYNQQINLNEFYATIEYEHFSIFIKAVVLFDTRPTLFTIHFSRFMLAILAMKIKKKKLKMLNALIQNEYFPMINLILNSVIRK